MSEDRFPTPAEATRRWEEQQKKRAQASSFEVSSRPTAPIDLPSKEPKTGLSLLALRAKKPN